MAGRLKRGLTMGGETNMEVSDMQAGTLPAASARRGFRDEAGALLRLGAPIAATQLCVMGMGFLDTAMAGRYGAADLAGVNLGGAVLWPAFMLLTGITMAVMPMVSQLVGARRTGESGPLILATGSGSRCSIPC